MKFNKILFTGFYSGYVPFAPGTAGTAIGLLLYILEYTFLGSAIPWWVNLIALILLFYPSVLICDAGEKFFASKDPGPVVWDEIIGYFVTMLFVPFSFTAAIAGFILFRITDIVKPFPANQLQSLKGGLGILIDDVVAGIYACAALHIIIYVTGLYGITFI